MKTYMVKFSFIACAAVLITLVALGCSKPKEEEKTAFLIRTPLMVVTHFEFSEELDLKQAAYPYDIDENPAEYNEMVIHLVKILSEEIVLLSAASQKGIMVTKEELELAEAGFKKDYPEDSFDQMLLENAIPYAFWKKRFKRNMIIEKLVNQELTEKIEITSQDIVAFYKDLQAKKDQAPGNTPDNTKKVDDETELVSRLRMQKTQDNYDVWIQTFWEQYPVEINEKELKTFLIALENTEGSENETKN